MTAAATTATVGDCGTMSPPSRGPGSSNSRRGYGNDQQLLVQRHRHSHSHHGPAPPSSYPSSLSWTRQAYSLPRKLVRIGPPPQHRMHPSHSPELTASSTSSSYVSTLSLSSSAPQIAFASIPEDRVVVAESSLHSSASWEGALPSPAQGKLPFPAGRWTATKTTPTALASRRGPESKRIDPLDLRRRASQPDLAPSPPQPSHPRSAAAHKDGAALDTFHLRFNRCDAEGLPGLRRLRGNFPIVITEDDEEGGAGEDKQADVDGGGGGADASSPSSSPPRSPQSPYEMLRDFAGASSWWHHPHYCPSSGLMRSLSCHPPPPPAARRDALLGS